MVSHASHLSSGGPTTAEVSIVVVLYVQQGPAAPSSGHWLGWRPAWPQTIMAPARPGLTPPIFTYYDYRIHVTGARGATVTAASDSYVAHEHPAAGRARRSPLRHNARRHSLRRHGLRRHSP